LIENRVSARKSNLSNHFSSWDKLSVESVKDVLEVLPLSGFFSVKELEKLLDEGMRDEDLD
jgi:hypothetical protein